MAWKRTLPFLEHFTAWHYTFFGYDTEPSHRNNMPKYLRKIYSFLCYFEIKFQNFLTEVDRRFFCRDHIIKIHDKPRYSDSCDKMYIAIQKVCEDYINNELGKEEEFLNDPNWNKEWLEFHRGYRMHSMSDNEIIDVCLDYIEVNKELYKFERLSADDEDKLQQKRQFLLHKMVPLIGGMWT